MAASILIDGVSKVYDDQTEAVRTLNLEIAEGEFVVFVGPSGCGKTTLLRMIAGLETITSGDIHIGGKRVNDLPPKSRDVAMVFQNYALYPNMSAAENMGFALKVRRLPAHAVLTRVREAARTLGLEDLLDRRPRALSGGQRQRVAMGRAIVREPQVFLMDEPLSNLDAKLRVHMRAEIARIQRDLGVTTVYVTHDQSEAMTLGDKVAIMKDGALQQFASPHELYSNPANLFVAGFIGSPAMNLIRARLEVEGDRVSAHFGNESISLPHADHLRKSHDGRSVVLGIRPEDIDDVALTPGARSPLSARVEIKEDHGADVYVHASVEMPLESIEHLSDPSVDDLIGSSPLLVARLDRATTAAEGKPITLAVNGARAYLFDPESGTTLLSPG